MKVTLFPCAPAVNESERLAFEHLRSRLQSAQGDDQWVLLTNLAFSLTHQLQPDEIDVVAIGPQGVRVVEVKHWTSQWVDANSSTVAHEAGRVTKKAAKIGTTLRKIVRDLPHVTGAFLLTQEASKVRKLVDKEVRGVRFYSLNGWSGALGIGMATVLTPQQVMTLGLKLEPKAAVAMDGSLRRLAGYVNLELQTPKNQRFHRVYKGSHPAWQDRVLLHLYDLGASDDPHAEAKAKREFDALHRLQLHAWAPRILDSYQDAPGYAGEMHFFTLVDPLAPSIEARAADASWDTPSRLTFARAAFRAVAELHDSGSGEEPMVHRNLNPGTILVKHDNSPILTGFDRTRIPSEISVASGSPPSGEWAKTIAPEIRAEGLGRADHRSDIYSLCVSLVCLFSGQEDRARQLALGALAKGHAEKPEDRATLKDLDNGLAELLGESVLPVTAPPARFWTEDQVVRFRDGDYRIVARLGSGGVGTTFKVVQVDRSTREDLGTYVAKVGHDREVGTRVLRSYSLARSHIGREPGLSTIFEVAPEWKENDFIALMTWIKGAPLGEFRGMFPLLAEDQQEESPEALGLRWLRAMCEAMGVLHRNGLIHGDISPRNMIVSGSDIVLTDYDFVGKVGEVSAAPGTVLYCAPSYQEKRRASPTDDIYALAASFFHVVFDREPFRYGGVLAKERGPNWDGVPRADYPTLSSFLDRATHPDHAQRFPSVVEALASLSQSPAKDVESKPASVKGTNKLSPKPVPDRKEHEHQPAMVREEQVQWLLPLLQSYPGSQRGNSETRGLDTDFAAQTYVKTGLEETLYQDILERRVRLVILCGNAGDGKTSLLQQLAARLGLGRHSSSEGLLQGQTKDGLVVSINLDGSAAREKLSADQILDEFLAPFRDGPPHEDIAHLLAINDGRLLEWIESADSRANVAETALTKELHDLLQGEAIRPGSHIRFVSLNQRSLVGGITADGRQIETAFLDRLVDQMYGGEQAKTIWAPCLSCSAQGRCEVFRAAKIFGPHGSAATTNKEIQTRARRRLFDAMQAVHLRGETHITVRELRSALAYVLFGLHFCDDYHSLAGPAALPYWDRAFSPDSAARQGDLLRELERFDPALEVHPRIDRHLRGQTLTEDAAMPPRYPGLSLESARRRAYFEWPEEQITRISREPDALDLARGRHLALFRDLPLMNDAQAKNDLCGKLCAGISRLEDLPTQARDRLGVVPLRITPRTPTETAFWVEKPLSYFRIEADLKPEVPGLERLHRQAHLIYRYRNGGEERLRLGADLFHLLLELSDGYQIGDVSTDDAFANLSIFVQRLVREDEREMFVWNPMRDNTIFKVSAHIEQIENRAVQRMILSEVETGGAA